MIKKSINNIIYAPISVGELVDKITILEIKKIKFKEGKLKNVLSELKILKKILNNYSFKIDKIFFKKLKKVNQKLWNIEDSIRIKEMEKAFDDDFVQLARSVYQENDKRYLIKKEINDNYKSGIVEEKDATDEQRQIKEINSGVILSSAENLRSWLPKLKTDNVQGEVYLTDIVSMSVAEGKRVNRFQTPDPIQVQGVNDRWQLATLERYYQLEQARSLAFSVFWTKF